MDQPKEEAAVAEIGSEISPPSAKRMRRCVQSKLSWHKPRVGEEEKEKCEEIEGEEKKKGKSPARTLKKDSKSPQAKLPWYKPRVEEEKVILIEEESKEPQDREEDGAKKGKRRRSQPTAPSPVKSRGRRSSAKYKSKKDKQMGEDTCETSSTSSDSDHCTSSPKRRVNNSGHASTKDVGQNTQCPLTDLRLEAKKAAEENSRLSAGKQTHPFFTLRKPGKSSIEAQAVKRTEMRHWLDVDGDYTVSLPPIHVFDKSMVDVTSIDWKNWMIIDPSHADLNGYCIEENASSVFAGKPLLVDNYHHGGIHLDQLADELDRQALPMASFEPAHTDGQQLNMRHQSCSISLSMARVCSEDNLENKQQDKLLAERLTSYYQRISSWPERSLWTNKYQPENAVEVCGNIESVRFLNDWLRSWNEKVPQKISNNIVEPCITEDSEDDAYETESDMDDETILKNVLLITGPVGSGKSAAIYACAKEQGFEVIEVNTSDVRNGAHMNQKFGQAMDSRTLNEWSVNDSNVPWRMHMFDTPSNSPDTRGDGEFGNGSVEMGSRASKQDEVNTQGSLNALDQITSSQTAKNTLILFEDVDTVFDEDRGFLSSILHLAETSKRPIILTSNCRKPVLPKLLDHHILEFTLPTPKELHSHLCMVCASENAGVSSEMLESLVSSCPGDIRKALMLLQFWCQRKELQIEWNTKSRYNPLDFDVDAAFLVMPRLFPWELQCKLSEKLGEEINRASLMLEQNSLRMETMLLEHNSMELIRCPQQSNVASPLNHTKRILFKRNISVPDSVELGDTDDLVDLSDFSDSSNAGTRLRVRRRGGIILSSQSDDGSGDECPCTDMMIGSKMPNMLITPTPQTTDIYKIPDLNVDPIHSYAMEDMKPLENLETASVSRICDTFKSQDVSCIPESSFISDTETNREDDFLAVSSHNTSFDLVNSIRSLDTLPKNADNTVRTNLNELLEDNTRNAYDVYVESVHGNEGQGGSQNEDDPPSCSYQLLDECSRADFSMRLLPRETNTCSPEVDLVQETWKKLRCGRNDLKSFLPANMEDVSLAVNHVSGLADLISEADLMFKSCYTLVKDTLEPTTVPYVEPDISSFYEDQMQMGSTYAQHGLCFYMANCRDVGSKLGHASTLDLAQEMLASSMNTMALGKLLSTGKKTTQNSHPESILTGREIDSELCDAVLCTVPARLSMVTRGSAFHEYLSFLRKLSKLEIARLSQKIEGRKRSRASLHYLSSGSLSLSDEQVQLLARRCCF